MTLELIFTLDYELFGDGSGSVNREQIIPTSHLLDIFDQYGAKLTIFFEYGQYLGYEKFSNSQNKYDKDNDKISEQLKNALQRGHDVQFHYHPTWYNAEYFDNKIKLDSKLFDISDLEETQLDEILFSGKVFLENLLQPIKENYRCNSFRAGAWSLKNPKKILLALKKYGFKCDSSVAPNAKLISSYGKFDYTDSPRDYGYWYIDVEKNSLLKKDSKKDFLELPIYTKTRFFSFTKYYNSHYLKSKNIISKFYKTKITEQNISKIDKLKKILRRDYYMADFNTMSHHTIFNMIIDVIKENKNSNESIPIVLIGHSKSSYFNDELHLLFHKLKKLDCIKYKTMSEVVEKLI